MIEMDRATKTRIDEPLVEAGPLGKRASGAPGPLHLGTGD